MTRRGPTALLLVAAGAAVVAAVLVGRTDPAPDVVPPPPRQVFVGPSDQDVLAAAARGELVTVERDPATGELLLVLPARYDPLTVEQVLPAPAAHPAGTLPALLGAVGLLVAAVLTGAGGRPARRTGVAAGLAALAVGVLVAGGLRGLLGGAPSSWPAGLALGAAALVVGTLARGAISSRAGPGPPEQTHPVERTP